MSSLPPSSVNPEILLQAMSDVSVLTFRSVGDALLSGEGAMTHVRTCAYFFLLISSIFTIVLAFPWRALWQQRPLLLLIAPALSLTALVLTWRLIFIFFVGFTQDHRGHADPPNLFVEAYVNVCDAPAGWWWSSMLLCWVTVACPVGHAETTRRGMPARVALAYIAAAFLGAVSLAFPLYLSHLLILEPTAEPIGPNAIATAAGKKWVWPACTLGSLLCIAVLPLSVRSHRPLFIGALAVVHVVLALPFLLGSLVTPAQQQAPVAKRTRAARVAAPPTQPTVGLSPTALRVLAGCTAMLYLGASAVAARAFLAASPVSSTFEHLSGFSRHLIVAAQRNVCQLSISIDAALSAIVGVAFMLLSARGAERAIARRCCLLSLLIGPAAALGLFAARRAELVETQQAEASAKGA
jgi:hypothetical protein